MLRRMALAAADAPVRAHAGKMSVSASPPAKRSADDWECKIRQINDVTAVISAPGALPPAQGLLRAAHGIETRPARLQV